MTAAASSDPGTRRVLVVDDDESIRNLLEVLVSNAGFQVWTAPSGEEAIRRLPDNPDAVLLDLIKPGIGGLGVLRHLKTLKGKLPAVILITAYEQRHPTVSEALMDPNVSQCLAKPLNHEVLIQALYRYTGTEARPEGARAAPDAAASGPDAAAPAPADGVEAAALASNEFFKSFQETSRRRLQADARLEHYPDKGPVFYEGDASDVLYLVASGSVELVKRTGDGQELVLTSVPAGGYFGEIGLLDGGGRNTGARAVGNTGLYKIPLKSVREALEAEPADVSLWVVRRLLYYLKTANERYMTEALRHAKIRLVGEMADSILHDLKTPLAIIQLASDSMGKLHPDAQTTGFRAMIDRQIHHILGMVRELLDFSRGTSELHVDEIAVGELFDRFTELHGEFLKRSQVRLNLSPIDAKVLVDPDRLLRVLQNLVANAVESLGGKGGEIALKASAANGSVDILVEDSGPGIPDDIRERVFEPFFTHGKRHGTGLGLSIVKSLVEAHGGRISFTTQMGKGTSFRIKLPAAKPR